MQDDLQTLLTLKAGIQTAETKVQKLSLDRQETGTARAALHDELSRYQADLKAREAEMAKEGSDWAQRKACLEAEIRDYREELETLRKGKTHAEIVGSDLEQE